MSGHKLVLWADGEDTGYDIVCLYDEADTSRPCIIPDCDCPELEDGYHFNGEDCNGKTRPGCNAADWLDAGGYESIVIPDRIEAEVAVDLSWGDPGPVFRAAPPDPKETQ